MIIGEAPRQYMSDNYKSDPMHSYAESFVNLAEGILNEGAVELYSDPTRAFIHKGSNEALKNFFVENSYEI